MRPTVQHCFLTVQHCFPTVACGCCWLLIFARYRRRTLLHRIAVITLPVILLWSCSIECHGRACGPSIRYQCHSPCIHSHSFSHLVFSSERSGKSVPAVFCSVLRASWCVWAQVDPSGHDLLRHVSRCPVCAQTAIACGECGGVVRHGCCGALSTDDSFLSMSDDDEFAQFCPDCGQSLKVADVVRNADVARVSVGRRTGRILRTPTRPSSQPRNGSDPAECDTCSERKQRLTRIKLTQRCLALPVSNPLTPHRMVAELAYISRPIVYLTSASVWGRSSWSAWLLSLLTEAVGVWSLRGQQGFSAAETEEVNRRRISLFLYLLRSPFYSKYTQGPLLALLGRIKKSLPWFSIFVDSIVHYLEYWHGLHMCTWAS
eukprot:m.972768 g.972768  ORF g.972768 m.972768 type:complete len:374 (-) comp23930_c0_seq32:1654-2775(-)